MYDKFLQLLKKVISSCCRCKQYSWYSIFLIDIILLNAYLTHHPYVFYGRALQSLPRLHCWPSDSKRQACLQIVRLCPPPPSGGTDIRSSLPGRKKGSSGRFRQPRRSRYVCCPLVELYPALPTLAASRGTRRRGRPYKKLKVRIPRLSLCSVVTRGARVHVHTGFT